MDSPQSECHSADLGSEVASDAEQVEHRITMDSKEHGINPSMVEAQMQEVLSQVAGAVARMEITTPEILRVTDAYQAFRGCGQVLRGDHREFYHKSRRREKISTFVSHSWHGGPWQKILALTTFYNSRAAISLGCVSAVMMMLLSGLGYLPDLVSNWASLSGCLTSALVLMLWRPQTEVFLDRICISSEESLKTQAIFSLAGLLKRSDQMLILWDSSWAQRLWCLFEFAAFLKSKQSNSQVLVIRPTIIGGLSIATFSLFSIMALAMTTAPVDSDHIIIPMVTAGVFGLLSGYPAASLMRGYFRSLDLMEEQLLSISFAQTRSACCDSNHISHAGRPLLCDRKVVQECVSRWFGSEAAFIESIHDEVLNILKPALSGTIFTREWALGVTLPAFWADLDFAAYFARLGRWDRSAAFIIEGLAMVFVFVPPTAQLLIQICRLYRHKTSSPCREVLYNLFVMFLCSLPIMLALMSWILSSYMVYVPVTPNGGSVLLGSATWFLLILLQGIISQRLLQRWTKSR